MTWEILKILYVKLKGFDVMVNNFNVKLILTCWHQIDHWRHGWSYLRKVYKILTWKIFNIFIRQIEGFWFYGWGSWSQIEGFDVLIDDIDVKQKNFDVLVDDIDVNIRQFDVIHDNVYIKLNVIEVLRSNIRILTSIWRKIDDKVLTSEILIHLTKENWRHGWRHWR